MTVTPGSASPSDSATRPASGPVGSPGAATMFATRSGRARSTSDSLFLIMQPSLLRIGYRVRSVSSESRWPGEDLPRSTVETRRRRPRGGPALAFAGRSGLPPFSLDGHPRRLRNPFGHSVRRRDVSASFPGGGSAGHRDVSLLSENLEPDWEFRSIAQSTLPCHRLEAAPTADRSHLFRIPCGHDRPGKRGTGHRRTPTPWKARAGQIETLRRRRPGPRREETTVAYGTGWVTRPRLRRPDAPVSGARRPPPPSRGERAGNPRERPCGPRRGASAPRS